MMLRRRVNTNKKHKTLFLCNFDKEVNSKDLVSGNTLTVIRGSYYYFEHAGFGYAASAMPEGCDIIFPLNVDTTKPFTVEGFFRPTAPKSGCAIRINAMTYGSMYAAFAPHFGYDVGYGPNVAIACSATGNTWNTLTYVPYQFPSNIWTHFAFTYKPIDSSKAEVTLFSGGVPKHTLNVTPSTMTNSALLINLATDSGIDDLRISDGLVYTNYFTPPTEPLKIIT